MPQVPAHQPIQAPYPLALVICDNIWKDPYTGKITLLGTFSTIAGSSVPLFHPIFSVYAAITDGIGESSIKLRLVDCDEARIPVFQTEWDYSSPDPRMVMEFAYQQAGLTFDEFGEYRLQLLINEEVVIERRILVIQTTPRSSHSEDQQ